VRAFGDKVVESNLKGLTMLFSKPWLYLLVACTSLVAPLGCHRQSAPQSDEEAVAVPTIPVVHPTPQTIIRKIQQPGYIKPYEQTPIYSKIAGYVEEVKVDIGQSVKKGDLLLRMFVPEMEQDLNAKEARVVQARAEVVQAEEAFKAAEANVNTQVALVVDTKQGIEQARAENERWEKEYDRAMRLFKGNVYDQQTLDESKNQKDQSKAGTERALAKHNFAKAALVESEARHGKARADVAAAKAKQLVAEADRDQSKAWLDYREIRAPYDGIITLRNVHTGHFLQSSSSGTTNKAAEPLFVMVNWDLMRINVQVPEYDAELVRDGMPAMIRFPSLNLPDFPGNVTRSTWAYDDQARTLRAEIHLQNPKKILHPGMYAHAVITAQLADVLTLPTESLMNEGDGIYCYLIEGGKAVRTAIQTGVKNDRLTQVKRKQERHIGAEKSDKWEEFTGREDVVARNPTSLIDGQPATGVASSTVK
jgi:HlyD family secretion protein